MGSQQEKSQKSAEEIPNVQFQSKADSSQTETGSDVRELSQKMEELSSQEKPEEDDIIYNDSRATKVTKKRPIDDNEKIHPTKTPHMEIKEETNKRPEKKAKQDDSSSSDDEESDLVQRTFDVCARILDLPRKYDVPDRDRHEAISFIEKRIIELESFLEDREDPRPIQRPCRVTAIDGHNACLLDLLEMQDELFQLRTKVTRSLQDIQACLSIYKATLTQLRKFNK